MTATEQNTGTNAAGTLVNFAKLLLKIKVYWPTAETTRKVSHSRFIYCNLLTQPYMYDMLYMKITALAGICVG